MFADLAGFTALTEAHADDYAADLAVDFARRVRDSVASRDGELVKTIGDAVVVRMDAAASAVALDLEIVGGLMANHGEPIVRVGMHTGPASERDGDFFGASINLAARITAFAGGGQVVLSTAARDAAGSIEGARFVPLGTRRLRNATEPVVLYAAMRHPAAAQAHTDARSGMPNGDHTRTRGRANHPRRHRVRVLLGRLRRPVRGDPSAYTLTHFEL